MGARRDLELEEADRRVRRYRDLAEEIEVLAARLSAPA
jgi:hypothetical protein